jgi:hypothetical protein
LASGLALALDGNTHEWKDADITQPHPHIDCDVPNFVLNAAGELETFGGGRYNARTKRFTRHTFSKEFIKGVWFETLLANFPADLLVLDSGEPLTEKNVNAWLQEIPLTNRAKLLHHLRYRRRRGVVDFWKAFENGRVFDSSEWSKDFAVGVLAYKNRCCTFGFWRSLGKHCKGEVVVPAKRCPICGEGVLNCGRVYSLPDRYNVVDVIKSRVMVTPPPPLPGTLHDWGVFA